MSLPGTKKIFFYVVLPALILSLATNFLFFRVLELKIFSPSGTSRKKYYFVNIFTKDFRENDTVIAKKKGISFTGVIIKRGPATIKIYNDRIEVDGKIYYLKKPVPEILNKNRILFLKEEEYFLLGDVTVDSYYMGKVEKNEITGKVLYTF